jgi:alkanesulfonate monooxygenase SsuD/methylene tetrahydromethanopterin reductase-like flavin-dependent oxidoreductase (luciferase family)
VAAVTSRIRVGTSVLAAPRYGVAELVRSLASLDVLSEGRLTIGLGLGWSDATAPVAGPSGSGPTRHLEEVLDALDARWGELADEDARVAGRATATSAAAATATGTATASLAPADLVPRRQVRPPVLLSASNPAGLARVARRADGWNPIGLDPDTLRTMWDQLRQLAAGCGRDPGLLQLVVRADVVLTERAQDGARRRFCGSVEQVADDLEDIRAIGADEVILRAGGDVGLDESLDLYARVAEAVGSR